MFMRPTTIPLSQLLDNLAGHLAGTVTKKSPITVGCRPLDGCSLREHGRRERGLMRLQGWSSAVIPLQAFEYYAVIHMSRVYCPRVV